MLSTPIALASPAEPLDCDWCTNGRIDGHSCSRCHGTGHVLCETCSCDTPAVTTSLTDRDIKLCASCARDDERDVRAWLTTTGLSGESISRFFALAPELTEERLHALIPLPISEYVAEIERMVARKEAA